MFKTLRVLRSTEAWRFVISRALEIGAQRLAEQRQVSSKSRLNSETNNIKISKASVHRPRVWAFPNASKVLDRPYPKISGRRHVPKLVNANRVPFLRFKKPQSEFVSRVIRDTVKTRERRIAHTEELNEQKAIAQAEDRWDSLLFNEFRLKDEEMSWSHEIQTALGEIQNLQTKAMVRRIDISARMHEIVKQERELAMEEKRRMLDERRQRFRIRRESRSRESLTLVEQGKIMDIVRNAPHVDVLEMSVNSRDNLKTREKTGLMQQKNTVIGIDEEISAVKAARTTRKKENVQVKAEKARE